jgi:hypothetical protein
MTQRTIANVVVLLFACSGKPPADEAAKPAITNARKDSCREQASAMRTFMRDLFEDRPVTAPWATGDAALDQEIELQRVKRRKFQDLDPSQPAPPLTRESKPGPIDHELAGCTAATEQLAKVGNAEITEEKLAAWVGIADAIETCDCRPRIAYLEPMFYMLVRGPD